jgi:FG-GAP repeat
LARRLGFELATDWLTDFHRTGRSGILCRQFGARESLCGYHPSVPAKVGLMSLVLFCLLAAVLSGADLPRWRETTLPASLKMGYQLVVADLNRDGRPDLIVVDEQHLFSAASRPSSN